MQQPAPFPVRWLHQASIHQLRAARLENLHRIHDGRAPGWKAAGNQCRRTQQDDHAQIDLGVDRGAPFVALRR